MKNLKDLKIVLIFMVVVLVLVIVRTAGKNGFNQDAKNAVKAVSNNNFSISLNELKTNEKDYLIVDLSESVSVQYKNHLQIPLENLIDKINLQKLKETKNKILLFSDNHSNAEKAWVILNQLGFKNVFILSNDENIEVFKYEFHPDTAVKLESVAE